MHQQQTLVILLDCKIPALRATQAHAGIPSSDVFNMKFRGSSRSHDEAGHNWKSSSHVKKVLETPCGELEISDAFRSAVLSAVLAKMRELSSTVILCNFSII